MFKTSIAQLTTAYTSSFSINSRSFAFIGGSLRRSYSPTLVQVDEARVVFVGAHERIIQQVAHTSVACGQSVLQPLEHLLRLLAQGIVLGDLAAGGVGVFIDQFLQRRVGFGRSPLA